MTHRVSEHPGGLRRFCFVHQLNRVMYWIALQFYTGQSFIDTANKCKWIHVEKNNHVFSYTLVGPDLDTFLELNIETAIDNQVSAGSTDM